MIALANATFFWFAASQITTTAEYAKDYAGALKKVIEKKHPREKEYRRKK
jgi:hypothetical protein